MAQTIIMDGRAWFQVSLKVILKKPTGEVLVLRCPSESTMAGYYDFPGGRIDRAEIKTSLKKIIAREMREEIGNVKYRLNEKPVAFARHFYKRKNNIPRPVVWIFFEAEYRGGKVKISSEHDRFAWVRVRKNNLKHYFRKGALEGMRNYSSGR